MNIIILGDKYQKGMKSKGCPALIRLSKNSNILQNQYSILTKQFPQSKIIYVAGFEFKKIQTFLTNELPDIVLINNDKYNDYNDSYALSLVENYLNSDTLIIFGYHILSNKMFSKFDKKNGSQVFISDDSNSTIGCVLDNNRIINISFNLPNTLNNIYYLNNQATEYMKNYTQNIDFRNYFIFEIINLLSDKNIVFKTFFTNSGVNYAT